MWFILRRVDPLDNGCQNLGHLETPGDGAMQLMSVSAAARHLGYKSRTQLYKLMNDGLAGRTCADPDAEWAAFA